MRGGGFITHQPSNSEEVARRFDPGRPYLPYQKSYYEALLSRFEEEFDLASKVRAHSNSPVMEVETVPVRDMAERVEVLIGPEGIAKKIRRIRSEFPPVLVPFRLADELISEREDVNEAELLVVLRASLATMTPPSITAAPTEGIVNVRIKSNFDGSKYMAVYFAGPMRSAGGTEVAGAVVLADYIRRSVGLSRYVITDDEVGRFIEEVRLYRRRVGRFQYNVPEEVLELVLRNLPIEITGIATDPIYVPALRKSQRIETPYLRGGALIVVNDGIVGRAKKVLRMVELCGLEGWEWLHEVIEQMKRASSSSSSRVSSIDEVVGGRPILSTSSMRWGFRLRYGRSPNNGMSAIGIHPYSMRLLENFIVTGTQLRVDYPGKSGVSVPVDSIEPPVVLMSDGSVIRVDNKAKLEEAEKGAKEILFNGDVLVSFGDCVENNVRLRPPGYCEEWWAEEVRISSLRDSPWIDDRLKERLSDFVREPFYSVPTVEEAALISTKLRVPLHPRYLPAWEAWDVGDVEYLRRWLRDSISGGLKRFESDALVEYDAKVKRLLEIGLVTHRVRDHKIVLSSSVLKSLIFALRPFNDLERRTGDVREFLESLTGLPFRPKIGSTISARVGRPEKSGQRRMRPPSQVLFPVGLAGGMTRDVLRGASGAGHIVVELINRVCTACGEKTWKTTCESCGRPTIMVSTCERCGVEYVEILQKTCYNCKGPLRHSSRKYVDLRGLVEESLRKASEPKPPSLKGVRGLNSLAKQPEDLVKGVLRANLDLFVYKDGTVRFDTTNAPLTHFSPKQIGVPPERLRELGYVSDVFGDPLVSWDQTLELMVQDVIVPKRLVDHLFKVSRFIDGYLRSLGLEAYYMLEESEDLIGHLVAVLSPHTYGSVVCRIIGFVDANVMYAHPILHGSKRRDCDGDEDSVTLLLDVLINFSRMYLPDRIGGSMDAPLLITPVVLHDEVDEQAYNFEVIERYPLEFYRAASEGRPAVELEGVVKLASDLMREGGGWCVGARYTTPTSQVVTEVSDSNYKRLKTMLDKVKVQLELAKKISAVNEVSVAERVMASHILPDILGNMKSYFSQSYICKRCGAKYRRPPLSVNCRLCGGEISQTVYRGTVSKYLELAEELLTEYIKDPYLREGVIVAMENFESIFKRSNVGKDRQSSLKRFF
ncbi:MAG: DNA polymerase II large subunit [Aigarchaeota archaeon]|nr:DNA polymerase II large subunit [Aigarchaeota archaeon]MDW8093091.1 DNA polymerase II large subunit [Nitrososphaerota archaeon]